MGKGPTALPEPPIEELRKVVEQYPEVHLVVRRQDPKGQWASLPSFSRSTVDLTDGSLEEYIRTLPGAGGGRYRVQAVNPQDHNEQVCPAYFTAVSGPANPWAQRGPSEGQPPHMQSQLGGGGRPSMPWGQPTMQPAMLPRFGEEQQHMDPSQFMSQTPDAIAMHFNERMMAELATIKKDREDERLRSDERLEVERERSRKMEMELQELKRTQEIKIMELRMETLGQTRIDAAHVPRTDYAALIAAVVPLLTTVVESGTSRSATAVAAQQKATELQMNGMNTLLQQSTSKKNDDGGATKMLESIMPLILAKQDENSPSKMADLIATMSEGSMTQLSLISTIMQNMLPEGDDPLTNLVTSAIEGMQDIAQVWAKNKGDTQDVPALPGGSAPQQSGGPAKLHAGSSPKDFADAIWQTPTLPQEFRTQEWYAIFIGLHDRNVSPEGVATAIARYLDASYEKNTAPDMFKPIFEDDVDSSLAPSSYLKPFLLQLPLAQLDMARLTEVCVEFDRALEPADEEEQTPGNGQDGPAFTPMQMDFSRAATETVKND